MDTRHLQTIQQVMKAITTNLHQQEKDVREYVRAAYEKANPDSEDGKQAFFVLNNFRTAQRSIKKDLKRLAEMNKQIKESLSKNAI